MHTNTRTNYTYNYIPDTTRHTHPHKQYKHTTKLFMTGTANVLSSKRDRQKRSQSSDDEDDANTIAQGPKNQERLKAVFLYRKSLLTQYAQALENLRTMNAAEIQTLESIILITKNKQDQFDEVVKFNIRKTSLKGCTKESHGTVIQTSDNKQYIMIQGSACNKMCTLQLHKNICKGALFYNDISNGFQANNLLTTNDPSWSTFMKFDGANCEVKNLPRFQANVRAYLRVAEAD